MIESNDLDFLLIEANFYGIDGLIEKIQHAKVIREKEQKQKSSQTLIEIQGKYSQTDRFYLGIQTKYTAVFF